MPFLNIWLFKYVSKSCLLDVGFPKKALLENIKTGQNAIKWSTVSNSCKVTQGSIQ